MTSTIKLLLTGIIFSITSWSIYAQGSNTSEPKTRFFIEIDPATFVFKGYSAHLRIQPKFSDHMLIGVGIYAMDLPSVFVDFNKKNKDEGWDVRLNQGYGLFAEHHFGEVNKKWFAGAQTSIQEYRIKNDAVVGSQKFSNLLLMAYAGYTLKPFGNKLYFKPWAGLGFTTKVSGDNFLIEYEYDIAPMTVFATLHVGYMFN